jgi:hypothetical protein
MRRREGHPPGGTLGQILGPRRATGRGLRITSSVAIVNDTTSGRRSSGHGDQDASSCTWTAGRVPRVPRRRPTPAPCSASTLGLELPDGARLQRRHRAHRVLRLVLDPRHGAALARRSVRLPAPMARAACAHGERATHNAPLDWHRRDHLPNGVASNGLVSARRRVSLGRSNRRDLQGFRLRRSSGTCRKPISSSCLSRASGGASPCCPPPWPACEPGMLGRCPVSSRRFPHAKPPSCHGLNRRD